MTLFLKKIVKYSIQIIIYLFSKLYTYNLNQRLSGYRNKLYTMWMRSFVGEIGTQSLFVYPCSLQGGGQKQIYIGNNTIIQSHGTLGCWEQYGDQRFTPKISIGCNCCIGEYNQITACNHIIIGNGLLTGRYVYIGDNAHGGLTLQEANIPPLQRRLFSKGKIVIGDNVWIGDKVTILGGVNIGTNVIVAANAVVLNDVPSNSIVAGVPAKVVKSL